MLDNIRERERERERHERVFGRHSRGLMKEGNLRTPEILVTVIGPVGAGTDVATESMLVSQSQIVSIF